MLTLTPFANDPVSDSTAEALFVRDDETGEAWSPTPGPMRRDRHADGCLVRHTAGSTRFSRTTHGIRHELDVLVHPEDPVKFSTLLLVNDGAAPRALSLFAYNERSRIPGGGAAAWHRPNSMGSRYPRQPFR